MTANLRRRRPAVLEEHLRSEIAHGRERCLASFDGVPRYEMVPTGQVHEDRDAVIAYHRGQRTADQMR